MLRRFLIARTLWIRESGPRFRDPPGRDRYCLVSGPTAAGWGKGGRRAFSTAHVGSARKNSSAAHQELAWPTSTCRSERGGCEPHPCEVSTAGATPLFPTRRRSHDCDTAPIAARRIASARAAIADSQGPRFDEVAFPSRFDLVASQGVLRPCGTGHLIVAIKICGSGFPMSAESNRRRVSGAARRQEIRTYSRESLHFLARGVSEETPWNKSAE